MAQKTVTVIGAGLAGCEAAWQLATRGIQVNLYEMKPRKYSPVHQNEDMAELVCSNSLRSDRPENAAGLLKEEMRTLGSLIMKCADETRVPAGGSLAVDRAGFSRMVTKLIEEHPLITVIREEVKEIPAEGSVVIASGPLTEGAMAEEIRRITQEADGLHFFDAVAPIVYKDSVDMESAFESSRYNRGSDYLNCPMTKDEYEVFYQELIHARCAPVHGEEENMKVFEGCLPVEVLASRGHDTLLFGPLKPVGLIDPHTGKRPFAVVQLRQDDADGTAYNLVGFQTRLAYPEQKRVFGLIPALKNAEYMRYGVMHRSTYIDSPGILGKDYTLNAEPRICFAGQITGVEGYIESTASGMLAGIALARRLNQQEEIDFTDKTAIGALGYYVSRGMGTAFVPMNVNYGIIAPPPATSYKGKKNKIQAAIDQSRTVIGLIAEQLKGEKNEI